jgi:hypothetical protein
MCDIICEYFNGYISEKGEEAKLSFTPRMYIDAAEKRDQERHEWEREDRENRAVETRSYPKTNGVATAVKSADEKELILKQYQKNIGDLSESLEKPIKEWVEDLQELVLSELESQKSLTGLFNLSEWGRKLREKVSPLLAKYIVRRVEEVQAEIGDEPLPYPQESQSALEDSLSKIAEPAKTIDKELDKIIKEEIRRDPENAFANIKERVNGKFTEHYSESKVKLIAKQSAKVAENSLKRKVAKRKGWKLQWVSNTFRDGGNFREDHAKLDGKKVEADEPFEIETVDEEGNTTTIKTDYPNEPSQPASQAIGCECTIKASR